MPTGRLTRSGDNVGLRRRRVPLAPAFSGPLVAFDRFRVVGRFPPTSAFLGRLRGLVVAVLHEELPGDVGGQAPRGHRQQDGRHLGRVGALMREAVSLARDRMRVLEKELIGLYETCVEEGEDP